MAGLLASLHSQIAQCQIIPSTFYSFERVENNQRKRSTNLLTAVSTLAPLISLHSKVSLDILIGCVLIQDSRKSTKLPRVLFEIRDMESLKWGDWWGRFQCDTTNETLIQYNLSISLTQKVFVVKWTMKKPCRWMKSFDGIFWSSSVSN